MDSPMLCAKCGATMEEGFIMDDTRDGQQVSKWIAGKPEPCFWRGIKIHGKISYKIRMFRCTSCGYLESYARRG